MKRYRLSDLQHSGSEHILSNVVSGRYLAKGHLGFKRPGERTHDVGCACPACDGRGRHVHPDECEVFIILQGKATMEVDGTIYDLVSGDVFVCEAGEDHHLIADAEEPCVNITLHVADVPHTRLRTT